MPRLLFTMPVVFIYGNHDHYGHKLAACPSITWSGTLRETRIHNNINVVACHYPLRSWNRRNYGALQLHGHCHGDLAPLTNQLDVGVDNAFKLLGEYRPFTENEVLECVNAAPEAP